MRNSELGIRSAEFCLAVFRILLLLREGQSLREFGILSTLGHGESNRVLPAEFGISAGKMKLCGISPE